MSTITIGKDYTIDAAHFIPGHEKCGIMHGHTWHITVELTGELDPNTHMLMDFNEMNAEVRDLLKTFDHKTINDIISFPSAENMAIWLTKQLWEEWIGHKNIDFIGVVVREGEGGYAFYTEERDDE